MASSGRIGYVDAMRGLAMFMVVVYHVSFVCFHSDNVITRMVNVQLELPLFFFISGFFASCAGNNGYWRAVFGKFSFLVVPALLMMLLYCVAFDLDYIQGLQKRLKEGYWFPIVLFEFFVIYLLIDAIGRKLRLVSWQRAFVHLLFGVALVYAASFSEHYNARYPIINTLSVGEWWHYIFFAAGSMLFMGMRNVVNLLCNRWLSGAIICLFMILLVYSSKHGYGIFGSFAMLMKCVQILCGLFVVWSLFVKHLSLSSYTVCGRFLELVGRRSLDVYFLHYFFVVGRYGVCWRFLCRARHSICGILSGRCGGFVAHRCLAWTWADFALVSARCTLAAWCEI